MPGDDPSATQTRRWTFPRASADLTPAPGTTLVRLVGDVDVSIRDELRAALVPVVAARAVPVEIDTRGVDFIDSAGTALLVALATAAGGGRVLALERQRFLFELVGLERVLPVEYAPALPDEGSAGPAAATR